VILNPYAFTAAPGGSTHQYWRLNFSAAQTGNYVSLDEIEMRATAGGADQCSGGTASADSVYSGTYAAANAFDNVVNGSFPWASGGGAFPHWLKYAFAAPVSVAEVTVRSTSAAYGGPNERPKDFTIEWSDDNVAWTVARTVTGQTAWANNEVRTFSVP
jgi:hypothetical protein